MESPCIKICVIAPENGRCTGCHRTLDEIARWARMTAEERRAMMAELAGRKSSGTVGI